MRPHARHSGFPVNRWKNCDKQRWTAILDLPARQLQFVLLILSFMISLVPPLRTGIDEGTADRVFAHVAIPAAELQTFVDHLALQIGGPVLRHRRCLDRQLALQRQADTAIDEHARELRFGPELRELELGILERGDWPPERLPIPAVVRGPPQRRFAGSHRYDSKLKALPWQFLHQIAKSLTFLPDQIFRGQPNIIEE